VENMENPMSACSGCAGDYEDPDRTAWDEAPDHPDQGPRVADDGIECAIDEAGEG